MRSFLIISAWLIATSVLAQTSPVRDGFFMGAAVGSSSVSLSSNLIGSHKQGGGTLPNLKFGWMLNRKTALTVVLPGTVYKFKWEGRERDRGFEGIIPSAQFWATNRFWLLGGAGLGMDAPTFYDIKGASERKFYFGAAGLAAAGFEIWRRGDFALDLQARAHFGFVSAAEGRREGIAFSILLGANWY